MAEQTEARTPIQPWLERVAWNAAAVAAIAVMLLVLLASLELLDQIDPVESAEAFEPARAESSTPIAARGG